MVCVVVGEMPELLGLVEAPLEVLGGDKVLRHLDAVVDVAHLNNLFSKGYFEGEVVLLCVEK